MKASPECIVCLFRQALNTAARVTSNPEQQHKILALTAEHASKASLDQTPAALCQPVYEFVTRITGIADPYLDEKRRTNAAALLILPEIRALVKSAKDPLSAALHAAVAGNIIDLGIGSEFDIEKDIHRLMNVPFAVDDTESFRRALRPGMNILYLGDNAGEIVFDILLVEYLLEAGAKVTYTVKSAPIINDSTMEDAKDVGMTSLVPVIETGSNDIGVGWNNVSDEFRQAYDSADLILGKGHGNFETCEDRPGNLYFLLKAKCIIVANMLNVRLGDLVFKKKA